MRKLILYAAVSLVVALFAMPQKASASHGAGAEIIYEWVSDSTYRFLFKFYRDCTGIEEDSTIPLCIYEPCTGWSANDLMTWSTSTTIFDCG